MGSIQSWKVLSSEQIFKCPVFRVRKDRCELPDGRVMPGYYAIDCWDWVNVVAVTKENRLVLVEQYRHPILHNTWELPGGGMVPNELAEAAARRELLEETGYVPQQITKLGELYPNPATQSNRLHVFLATGCEPTGQTDFDPYEDIRIAEFDRKEVLEKLGRGEFAHALIVAGLMLYFRSVLMANL